MTSCTQVSTVGATLLSCASKAARPASALRPATVPTTPVLTGTGHWHERGTTLLAPVAADVQGGAVDIFAAAVIDLMVTDHPYSTRLGPPSCSPPV